MVFGEMLDLQGMDDMEASWVIYVKVAMFYQLE